MVDLNPVEIYPKIFVYKAAFKNPTGFIEEVKKLSTWQAWWTFGDMTSLPGDEYVRFDHKPSEAEWDKFVSDYLEEYKDRQGSELSAYVDRLFYQVTQDYMSRYPMELPNWCHQKPSIAKYVALGGVDDDKYSMHYHTDFQREKADAPGLKYALTCTMYLNDDYEGGELSFKIAKEDGTIDTIDYKPSAGDTIVFPSIEPYYHGVRQIGTGDRYFIRTFWTHYSEGTPEWRAGLAEHGSEKWAEMEKARESDFRHNKEPHLKRFYN